MGKKVKAWFSIDSFPLKLPNNLRFEQILELRILPRNRCFYAEFVYEVDQVNAGLNPQNALGIDPGLNNWLTCVSNVGTSFIIDGKHLKSLNRWYNKKVSTIKECKPQGFWSKKLAHWTEKRNDDWKPSGKRVKRGLYRTAFNWYINADVNAAANILRKVSTTLNLDLSGVSRVSLTTPQRVFLWSARLKRRDVALACPFVSA